MTNTKATKTAATGQANDLDALGRRLKEIQGRREAAQAACAEEGQAYRGALAAAELGEASKAKIAVALKGYKDAKQRLLAVQVAAIELERRIAAAEVEQTAARKAALLKAIRGHVRQARSVVEQALAIDQTMVGLGEEMSGAVKGIKELVSEYHDIDGRTPCTFPSLHGDLMKGLRRNASGFRTGAPEFLAGLWGDSVARGSAEYPVEVDSKGRPQSADGGAA